MSQTNKLINLLERAKKDLQKWLNFANVSSLDEFYEKQENIKKQSYHKYTDVIEHINFIKKIEVKLGKY
ncbi:MAG: hypothetical protein ABGW74_01050 [Campylobacterales bacterium]